MAVDITFIILYVKLPPVSSFDFTYRLLLPSLPYLQYKTGQISVDENTIVKCHENLMYYPNWALYLKLLALFTLVVVYKKRLGNANIILKKVTFREKE